MSDQETITSETTPEESVQKPSHKKRNIIVTLIVIIVIALGVGGYFYFGQDKVTNPAPVQVTPVPLTTPAEAPAEPTEVPTEVPTETPEAEEDTVQ